MTLITLNRPDVYTVRPLANVSKVERGFIKQKPVTINPEYIASMVEHFDDDKEFESTELYLSNGILYHVTSRIEEIIEMISCADNDIKQVSIVGNVVTI